MPPESPGVSVVIPLKDEDANVDPLLAELVPVLEATGLPFTARQIADYITDRVQPLDHSGVWEAGVTGEARIG